MDYGGDEVGKALPLVAQELEPGLPDKQFAAKIPAISLCSRDVAEWRSDADARVLPRNQWPPEPPKAIVRAEQDERSAVGRMMYERGMAEPIELQDVFFFFST